jgi:tetratricopeptide (TPR) repeat protein
MTFCCLHTFGFLAIAGLVTGCASPSFVDKGKEDASGSRDPFNSVVFQVHDAYKSSPPNCVAVLPFETSAKDADEGISVDQTETVRRAFYAHLAPQGKRDIELPRINFVLSKMDEAERTNVMMVGEQLNCGAVVQGHVTEYGSNFYGVYSKVAVGADLKLLRAVDGEVLWEGSHVAQSHGGSVPLSPIGLAMGIYDASNNVREEQIYRIIDDLARRLVSTIPDDQVAVLDEPLTEVKVASTKPEHEPGSIEEFMASLDEKSVEDQKSALLDAIKEERFGEDNSAALFEKLTAVAPDDPDSHSAFAQYMVEQGDYTAALQQAEKSLALDDTGHATHFLKGRILIKLDDLNGADQAIVKAAAMDENNAAYLNGLGYVNSLRGNNDRALAAYQIAIQRDPANGYAYYNTAVTLQNLGDAEEAADAYYGAGLAYIKTGDYGPATKALTDLKGLVEGEINRSEEIKTLEDALLSLTKGEDRDA